jgi:hypothetical protein
MCIKHVQPETLSKASLKSGADLFQVFFKPRKHHAVASIL